MDFGHFNCFYGLASVLKPAAASASAFPADCAASASCAAASASFAAPASCAELTVLHRLHRPMHRRSRRPKLHSLAQLSVGLRHQPDVLHHADFARHRKFHDSNKLFNGSVL